MYSNTMNAVSAPAQYTPSELVLLYGEQFAQKGGPMDMVELLQPKVWVSAHQLGFAMLAAAVLANEQTGVIQLQVQTHKTLMIVKTHLHACPGTSAGQWLHGSIEMQIADMVQHGPTKVGDLVGSLLHGESNLPWDLVARRAKEGLAARGLVEMRTVRHIFSKTEEFHLPRYDSLVPDPQVVGYIRYLFTHCEQGRPDIWQLLNSEFATGIRAHYPQSDEADFSDD